MSVSQHKRKKCNQKEDLIMQVCIVAFKCLINVS